MRLAQLKQRLQSLTTRYDACVLAADLHPVRALCDGTLAEQFVAGWENAMLMADEGHPEVATDEGFLNYCLSEVRNMGVLK